MKTIVKKYQTYKFSELSENIQQTVLENLYDINVDTEFWHECIIDDCTEIGKLIGIDIDKIFFQWFQFPGRRGLF